MVYKITVFGKKGCQKCAVLKGRLEKLIASDYSQFELVYKDIITRQGLVDFCKMEVFNPQRIPCVYISNEKDEPVVSIKEEVDSKCGQIGIYGILGLQTDYDTGNGVLSVQVLKDMLNEVK